MQILITGAAGMLGADVANEAKRAGHGVAALAREECDITQDAPIAAVIDRVRPDVVVNCAAFTDVDGAESQSTNAEAVNGQAAGRLAARAASAGAWIVHISSDYVFDGRKREPYVESDPLAPLSAYGRSKLAGETAVARAAPERHTIVRSSWLFGAAGPCFPKTIRRLAAEREQLTVVDDQVGCPTFTGHLASALVDVAQRRVGGVVHVAAAGACSWYEFAQEIVRRSGLSCEVVPGTTAALARPAPRPAYSVLGTERPDVAPRLPDWQAGLEDFLTLTSAVAS